MKDCEPKSQDYIDREGMGECNKPNSMFGCEEKIGYSENGETLLN